MAQAKTLTREEMTRLLDYINTRRFSQRNRAMMLLTHLAGLRIGEVACLRWSDVMNLDGTVKDEIRLLPDMTKGRHARTVFVNIKLREELQAYAVQARKLPQIENNMKIEASISLRRRDEEVKVHGEPDCCNLG